MSSFLTASVEGLNGGLGATDRGVMPDVEQAELRTLSNREHAVPVAEMTLWGTQTPSYSLQKRQFPPSSLGRLGRRRSNLTGSSLTSIDVYDGYRSSR